MKWQLRKGDTVHPLKIVATIGSSSALAAAKKACISSTYCAYKSKGHGTAMAQGDALNVQVAHRDEHGMFTCCPTDALHHCVQAVLQAQHTRRLAVADCRHATRVVQ